MSEAILKINEVLKTKPLIFFGKEAERAIGLEKHLTNYNICCIEDSYIVDQLITNGSSVFCLEKEMEHEEFGKISKTTTTLISHPKVIEWIKKITGGNEFYALTFMPSNVVNFKINKLGGTLLNNPYDLNLKFENKLTQSDLLESKGVSKPKSRNLVISDLNYQEVATEFGLNFVIQTEKSHTGNGTFFVETEAEFTALKTTFAGNKVKLSELIDGYPCTINCCIYKNKLFIGPIQYQITGIPGVENTDGVTIGNDFSSGNEILNSTADLANNLITELSKIGSLLLNEKYQGVFGVDFVVRNNSIYVIEINARQTANIPFQTKLEIGSGLQLPMMAIHLCEFLNIDILGELANYQHLQQLSGSQVFVRSLQDDRIIIDNIKSGVYRLQSDNSAQDWSKEKPEFQTNVIFLDEEMDKPLIFQTDSYSIDTVQIGFLIIAQKKGSKKNRLDEILRIQFKDGIITEGKLKPWVLEMYKYFSRP